MRTLILAALMSGLIACGGDRAIEPSPRELPVCSTEITDSQATGNDAGQIREERKPTGRLCLILDSGEDSELMPGAMLVDQPPDATCVVEGEALRFELEKDTQRSLWLYGFPEVTYCLTVSRELGYLELDYQQGSVAWSHDEPSFRWCVLGSKEPQRMTIRSRTNRSKFRLRLDL